MRTVSSHGLTPLLVHSLLTLTLEDVRAQLPALEAMSARCHASLVGWVLIRLEP